MNPLLDFSDLPRFDIIKPQHLVPALGELIAQADAALQDVTQADFPAHWDPLSSRLGVALERLSRVWSTAGHLQAVADEPEMRAAYNDCLPRVTDFFTRLGSDRLLYAKYKAINPKTLPKDQYRAHQNALRDCVMSGANLGDSERARFSAIQERLAELSQQFSEHVLDCTERWSLLVSAQRLRGVPTDVFEATAQAAAAKGLDGHLLNLKAPCYLPLMQYAQDRDLRQQIHQAYSTRASDLWEDKSLDNSALISEIMCLRQEEARLLGYDNAALASLASKMAQSPTQVIDFLRDLAQYARSHARRDVLEMREFARQKLALDTPEAWDWTFIGERLKEDRYAYSEAEVKAYFTAPRVLSGLFTLVESIFEVCITREPAPVWHPTVEFFRIERNGHLVGQFYLDTPARNGKSSGAWMDNVRSRWLRPDTGKLQTPVAHLVCNFSDSVNGKPALLTHQDVITLFHEFGHGLHHLLTQVNERSVSGINGVEWDAVELPSQFMENFCWEWSVLQRISAHVNTGENLPRHLFDKMLAAKNFQTGLQTMRQIEYSLFDMRLHAEPEYATQALELLDQVRAEISVLPTPDYNRMPHTFSHIFSGGYSAGYYSYKWAEVLSADAYAAFEESTPPAGTPEMATCRRFRQEVLEVGGSRKALDSFKAFRGREPQVQALLRHQGMATVE